MSSLEPRETNRAAQSVPAQLNSNWIEIIAVPVVSAIMETQPIAVALLLFVPYIFGSNVYPDAASITFLLLFLHWWSMGTRYVFERRGASPGLFTFYDILGILVALLLLTVTHLPEIIDPTFLFIALVVAGWSWKRGADRARAGLNEEQLINAFKIGFIVMLVVMVFALIALVAASTILADTLLRDLPIFFLAGTITLSFARIGIVKKEQARHMGGKRREKMGNWLTFLTIAWIVLVVASIALETLPLQTIKELLGPFWYVLGLIAFIIIYALDFIVTIVNSAFALIIALIVLLFHLQRSRPPLKAPPQTQTVIHATQDLSTEMFILRIVVIVLVIIATIVITRYLQKRRKAGLDDTLDEEEEVREGLNINQILRARREERRQRQQAMPLAALDQDSMRARYRAFLTSMAAQGEDFVRHPEETPMEYQRRILHAAHDIPASSNEPNAPADLTILDTLTRAYNLERYGEREADGERQNFLRRWMPHLVLRFSEHLTSKPKKIVTTSQKTIQSRWGED